MITLPLILSADTSCHLGRLDYATMSQQTLMEMLIDGVEDHKPITTCKHRFNPIAEWRGLTFTSEDTVSHIKWEYMNVGGSIDLLWLPQTVQKVEIAGGNLTGVIPLESFPVSVISLIVIHNRFEGSLNLTNAPENIGIINLRNNRLSGSLYLEDLPTKLRSLLLPYNAFTGTVCLTKLPESLAGLDLGKNMLSGTLDMTALPRRMTMLCLKENSFVGSTDFSKVANTLLSLDVSGNSELSGDLGERPHIVQYKCEGKKVNPQV